MRAQQSAESGGVSRLDRVSYAFIGLLGATYLILVWRHIWPPLPHIFYNLIAEASTSLGFGTDRFIKVALSVSGLFSIAALIGKTNPRQVSNLTKIEAFGNVRSDFRIHRGIYCV